MFVKPLAKPFGVKVGGSEGQLWKQKRTILNKIFTFDFVKMQIHNIVKICDRCIGEMEEKALKGKD